MSVWREVQEALYQRFVTAWITAGQSDAIQLENEDFDPPNAPWVQVLVQRRPGGPGTIGRPGNRKMDRSGAVFMLLREPPGNGIGDLSDRAEAAARIFENCRFSPHDIRFAQVEPGQASDVDNGRWRGVTVEGRFDYEDIR